MTKADIIDAVHENLGGLSRQESAEIVEVVFEAIKTTLAHGEKTKICGFGNFVVRAKKERVGRNPQTGASISISPRRVVTFQPSRVLRAAVGTRLRPVGPGAMSP